MKVIDKNTLMIQISLKMKTNIYSLLTFFILIGINQSIYANELNFNAGLAYSFKMGNIVKLYKSNTKAKHQKIPKTNFYFPAGFKLGVFYTVMDGIGIEMEIGPLMSFFIHEDEFIDLPIGFDIKYFIFDKSNISPFIKSGAKYNMVTGDYVEGSKIGFTASIGLSFLIEAVNNPIELEIAFDNSNINFSQYNDPIKYTKISPNEYSLSLMVNF